MVKGVGGPETDVMIVPGCLLLLPLFYSPQVGAVQYGLPLLLTLQLGVAV